MTTEAKKLNMIRKIMNLTDEATIDGMYRWMEREPTESEQDLVAKFATDIEVTFDLEKVKAEQGYRPVDKHEIEKLIKEADVKESIDKLLTV